MTFAQAIYVFTLWVHFGAFAVVIKIFWGPGQPKSNVQPPLSVSSAAHCNIYTYHTSAAFVLIGT